VGKRPQLRDVAMRSVPESLNGSASPELFQALRDKGWRRRTHEGNACLLAKKTIPGGGPCEK